ncbi:hypothetical protein FBEOM_449 [Fusarium beomiforme]|uniref:Uncharacterized protein n=1 Tax=Fusarium beomiforme TaxID=44412 RepID=A0A9P5E712_9HYPO|nr:hypothetical protein FBEOM_449 [Fusarium beomiforme]
MEQIANQLDRDDTSDIVEDMQNAPSSTDNPSARQNSKDGSGEAADGPDDGNTVVGGSGPGTSGSGSTGNDEGTEVIVFNTTNFQDSRVLQFKDSEQNQKFINFYKTDHKTTLDTVQWQVINGEHIKTLGDVKFSDAKPDGQLAQVTDTQVALNLTGETSDYYGKDMYIQIDWKKEGAAGYTKTELFTVTNITEKTEIDHLNAQLQKDDSQQDALEATISPSPSPSSTSTSSPSSSAESEKTSGGGLSTGATAGIAVGAVIGGLLIVGALVWFFLRRRRRGKQTGDEYVTQQTYAVDKETHGRATDSPNSPYSDENHMQPVALGSLDHDRGAAPTPPPGGVPRSSIGSHDRAGHSGVQTPQGMTSNVAHLVEDGMTADEIRRLEEEERQLDDEIERAARR